MVICEPLSLREEAVQYSIELAKRMETGLVFLMILPLTKSEFTTRVPNAPLLENDELEDQIKRELTTAMDQAQKAGLKAEAVVKMGEPASELMKFLAQQGSFQAIVWGGKDIPRHKKSLHKDHWLAKIQEELECPLLIPAGRS